MVRIDEDVENMEVEIEAITFGQKTARKKLMVNVNRNE